MNAMIIMMVIMIMFYDVNKQLTVQYARLRYEIFK